MKTRNITKMVALQILLVATLLVSIASVSALTIKSVDVNPNLAEPGEFVSLKVSLENNFNDDVENIQVRLDLGLVPIAPEETSTVFLEKIKEDRSDDFDFSLLVNSDAEAGVYKFPMIIIYNLNNQTIQESSIVSITVNAKPSLSLNVDGFLLDNQKNKLTIKIVNSGLAKAKFLEVSLGPGNYKILSSDKIYIGDLNSDDFDSFSFDIYANGPGTLTLPIELKYRDFANNEYTKSEIVQAKIYSQEEAIKLGLVQKSNSGLYVTILFILLVLWIVYRSIKKWSKNRKKRMNGR